MPADQYSTLLRVLEMADGNDDNTWGDNTNTNLNLLEQAIAKQTQLTLSQFTGNQYTLTTLDGQTDDSRAIGITLTGALTANVTVVVPNIARLMVFNNQCTNNYSASNPSGFLVGVETAAPIAGCLVNGGVQTFFCDGANNVYQITPPAARLALVDQYQQYSAGSAEEPLQLTYGNTINVDPSLSTEFALTLTGTPTNPLTFTSNSLSGLLDGSYFYLLITQDATGSRTVVWPTNVKWPNDVTPTLTAVGNGADMFYFQYRAASATWFGSVQQGYNPSGAAGTQHTVNISQNAVDWSLAGQVPGLTGTPTVNVYVPAGIIVEASSTGLASLNLANSGLPSGTTINLFVSGFVVGKSGRGGDGSYWIGNGAYVIGVAPQAGENGGTAIIGPGAGYTFNMTVESTGKILPGGGGGGGGGLTAPLGSGSIALGGGGGAGAGSFGAYGGRGKTMSAQATGSNTWISGTDGGNAISGPNSTAGTGGNGTGSGSGTGGSGGAGGAFGAAGTAGGSPTGQTAVQAGGAAGAAGWAVNNNNVSFTENILGSVSGSNYTGSGYNTWPYA